MIKIEMTFAQIGKVHEQQLAQEAERVLKELAETSYTEYITTVKAVLVNE